MNARAKEQQLVVLVAVSVVPFRGRWATYRLQAAANALGQAALHSSKLSGVNGPCLTLTGVMDSFTTHSTYCSLCQPSTSSKYSSR